MEIDAIRKLIQDELHAVNDTIIQQLNSDVALINQLSGYIINSGGKRLRPMLVLLSAKACNYTGAHHHTLAAVIEFIHTATLLHDDVVDASELRRGKDTANSLWGNEASILVGDFLYSRAFQMMVEVSDMSIMRLMADTTNTIAAGEVLQLLNAHDPETTEAKYFDVIARKTAKLFEASAALGPLLTYQKDLMKPFSQFGSSLGVTFQLVDDVLDYNADAETIGKNIGDDLAEGKPTLPLIRALSKCSQDDALILKAAIKEGAAEDQIVKVQEIISKTDAIEYTLQRAADFAEEAKQALAAAPDSDYKDALISLADHALTRNH